MHQDARSHPRLSSLFALLAGTSVLASSCYLTSSFDGLTSGDGAKGGGAGGATSSSTTGSGGTGGSGGATTSSSGTGGADAFPATKILDDFNRPNGAPGANWAQAMPGAYGVEGDQLVAQPGTPDAAYWSSTFGPRQEVFVTLVSFTENDSEIELLLKNQGGPSECDAIAATYNNYSGSRILAVTTCVDSNWTVLEPKLPLTLQPGDRFGMRTYEDGTVEVYRNSEKLGTWDASGWPGGKLAGRIGIYTSGLQAKVVFDDFGGGSF